VDYRNAVPAGS
jgi:putative transposase